MPKSTHFSAKLGLRLTDGIITKKNFDDLVREACQEFDVQTKRLRKQWWAKRVENWTIMGLGLLSSFCPLVGGHIVELGAGISIELHVYRGFRNSEQTTEKRKAQQLLAELKGQLNHPVLLKRIALSPPTH